MLQTRHTIRNTIATRQQTDFLGLQDILEVAKYFRGIEIFVRNMNIFDCAGARSQEPGVLRYFKHLKTIYNFFPSHLGLKRSMGRNLQGQFILYMYIYIYISVIALDVL